MTTIEIESGQLFREIGMNFVADDPPSTVEELEKYIATELAYVLVDEVDSAIAYILFVPLDGQLFIEQVTVDQRHSRRRIGQQLIDFGTGLASEMHLRGLSLTTCRDVSWNGPYYSRLGFEIVEDVDLTPGLKAKLIAEAARGLSAWPRVVMVRPNPGDFG